MLCPYYFIILIHCARGQGPYNEKVALCERPINITSIYIINITSMYIMDHICKESKWLSGRRHNSLPVWGLGICSLRKHSLNGVFIRFLYQHGFPLLFILILKPCQVIGFHQKPIIQARSVKLTIYC